MDVIDDCKAEQNKYKVSVRNMSPMLIFYIRKGLLVNYEYLLLVYVYVFVFSVLQN